MILESGFCYSKHGLLKKVYDLERFDFSNTRHLYIRVGDTDNPHVRELSVYVNMLKVFQDVPYMEIFETMKKVETLYIHPKLQILGDILPFLKMFSFVRELYINDAYVTDWTVLKNFSNLRVVSIHNCNVNIYNHKVNNSLVESLDCLFDFQHENYKRLVPNSRVKNYACLPVPVLHSVSISKSMGCDLTPLRDRERIEITETGF